MGQFHTIGVVQEIDQRTILLNHIDGLAQRFQMLVGVLDAVDVLHRGSQKSMTTKTAICPGRNLVFPK